MSELIVSIIIPCYNSGEYLPEAITSVEQYLDKEIYEIIIIDDGSTDYNTLYLLHDISKKYLVLRQENKGPAAARNAGVSAARGEYILLLDSDNKITPAYIKKGIDILNRYPNVGVVYGDANFFGDTVEQRFKGQKFDKIDIMYMNYIDMCSMVRKRVWEEVGGLDENRLIIGHEDWDFWIRIGATNWNFYYIPEILFDYRVRDNSLVKQASQPDKYQRMREYIYEKNAAIVLDRYEHLHKEYMRYKNGYDHYQEYINKPLKSIVKYLSKFIFNK